LFLKALFIVGAGLGCGLQAAVSEFVPYDGVRWRYQSVGRTVSIGDLHADADALLAILLHTGIITTEGNLARRQRVILLGDILSRGPNSRFILDFLAHLDQQARIRFPTTPDLVVPILGNHESLRCTGENAQANHQLMRLERGSLRFPETDSYSYLDMIADRALPVARSALEYLHSDYFHLYSSDEPLDPVERLQQVDDYAYFRAFTSNQSPYAQSIRQWNTIIQEDDTLFVHGGVNRWMGTDPVLSVGIINSTLRRALGEWVDHHSGLSLDLPMRRWILEEAGPLWMRELADEQVDRDFLFGMMRKLGVKRIVIGHSSNVSGVIETRYDGVVWRTDTGISRFVDGGLSAVEFVPGLAPRVINSIPRPKGMHPIRRKWEPIFAARRASQSPAVAELHGVLNEIKSYQDDCAGRLLQSDDQPDSESEP
jgi:hypothetical protein